MATSEEICQWFKDNHDLASERSPWSGRDGGYVYPTVDILDTLEEKFPDVGRDVLDEIVTELNGDDWISKAWLDDLDQEAINEIN